MKLLRNIVITLMVMAVCVYLSAFLLIPGLLNGKDYSAFLCDAVKKQTNLDLVIKNYKINVSPTLNISLNTESIGLFYPDKKQILDVKNAKLDFSTLALLNKEIKLKNISAQKVQVSAKILKNGKLSLQEYLEKNLKEDKNPQFKISQEIPEIKINEMIIKVKDEKTGQKFKFDSNNVRLCKTFVSSNLQLNGQGNIYCFDEKYFTYKLKLVFPSSMIKDFELKPIKISFDNLKKHRLNANIDADLRLVNGKENELYGHVNIDDFSMYANNTKLPPSYFHLRFEKDKGELDSEVFAAKSEKAKLKAKFNIGKSPKFYVNCNTKKISLQNLEPIIVTITDILNINTNLPDFNLTGYIMSDFEVETNLKSLKSHGKLRVVNGAMKHKEIPLKISNINADVDFSDNEIKILQSSLLINSQPVQLKGSIDKTAYGNITLSANNLKLNHIMNAFAFLKPSKDVIVKSGTLSFSAVLNGKLNKAVPKIDAVVDNFSALKNGDLLSIKKINANIKNQKKFNAELAIEGINFKLKDLPSSVSAEKITAQVDEKDFILKPSKFYYDKASLNVEGTIKDYSKSPDADFTMFGTVDTSLLKTLVPASLTVHSRGILPLGARISYKNGIAQIHSNILASKEAYFTPVLFKNLENTLLHLDASLKSNDLSIKECSLNHPPASIKLSQRIDTSKLKKILLISGDINNIKKPEFSKLHILIPDNLYFSYEPVNSAALTGDLYLNGNLQAPQIEGTLSLSDLYLPGLYIKKLEIQPQKRFINIKVNTAKIENTFLNMDIIAPSDFLETKKINNVFISSEKIDLQNLMNLSSLLPSSQYLPGNEAPFDVLSGKLAFKSAQYNNLKMQNVTSDFRITDNILYLDNFRASAYRGNIAGYITYNFPNIATHAILQARGLESSMAVTDLMPPDDPMSNISGKLNFDSDVTMSGLTQVQQMKTLKGTANVLISNAQLGPLGRFEHFLHAQNLLSQRFIFASLNSAKRAIAPKNTGYVNSLKGVLKINNGVVHLSPLTTSGPQMSMYVTGMVNLITSAVDVQILGKVSPDVSDSVGLLGDVTLKNILDEHTTYGPVIANLFSSYNMELPEMDISKIPALSSKYATETKNFRVLIDGDPQSVKSIRSFTWVNPLGTQAAIFRKKVVVTPEKAGETKLKQILESKRGAEPTPVEPEKPPAKTPIKPVSFLDNIPDSFK